MLNLDQIILKKWLSIWKAISNLFSQTYKDFCENMIFNYSTTLHMPAEVLIVKNPNEIPLHRQTIYQ